VKVELELASASLSLTVTPGTLTQSIIQY